MKIKSTVLLLCILLSGYACKQKVKEENTLSVKEKCSLEHREWTRNVIIYEVNIRQYTQEGTFDGFRQHLPRLKDLGVDILWFMPIYPISEKNRKGSLGSYYAIQNYKAVNPEFGTEEDFKNLVKEAHNAGFKVILDWVANHTGCDNVWTVEHPDWYVYDDKGNFVSPYDWTDTYKLDYSNQDMRKGMVDAMKYWIEEFDVDGFRCDMAHEVPTDFWNDACPRLDAVKPMFMLAESENYDLLEYAFDTNYSWELMHMMADIYKGEKNAKDIVSYLHKLDTIMCPDSYKMNFLTNHDENSWNGTEFERYGKGVEAFAVLTYTINDMPMLYTGQEVGLKKCLEFFDKNVVPSWDSNNITSFYKKLDDLKHTHPALRAGEMGGKLRIYRHSGEENLLIYSRKAAGKEILVMLNLSGKTISYTSNDGLNKKDYEDYFTGLKISELPKSLKAWEYRILLK